MPNAEVVVSNTPGPLALTVTDAAGTYRVEQVPLGAFTVDVFEASTGQARICQRSIFADGQEVPVNITEAALGVVRGTVLEAGSLSPLKAWRVGLIQTASNGRTLPALAAMSGVDGTFSFPGVSKGTVALNATHDTVSGSGTGNAVITREGQVVDVPLLANIVRPLFGAVQGQVRTPAGAPAANMVVTVCLGGCDHPSAPRAVTGPDGEFLIENMPLGRHRVRAVAQGQR